MPFLTDPLALKRIKRSRKAIADTWQHQVHDVVATGRLLIRAHDDLIHIHGAWTSMIANDLPFSQSTAAKLMEIARHPVLSSYSRWNRLPTTWTTLYELSKIDAPTLKQLITARAVTRTTTIADVERLRHSAAASTASSQQLAVIVSQTPIHRHMAAVTAAVNKFIDELHRTISEGLITRDDFDRIIDAVEDWIEQLEQVCSDGRLHVESMRTVNAPMWEEDDDEHH